MSDNRIAHDQPAARGFWKKLGDLMGSFSERTGLAGSIANAFDPDRWLPGGRDAAFTLALVALSAKMAVADGVVVNSEIDAFERLVDVPVEQQAQIERFFALAQEDVAGYQSYARRIARLFADTPETLELVLCGLFRIAAADGLIHEAEHEYLANVAQIFGFTPERFEQLARQHISPSDGGDPYLVLGLATDASDEQVKSAYRALAREHHPDRLHAAGIPDEMMELVTARMTAINAAYKTIRAQRRL